MTAELGRQPWLVYGLMRTARRLLATRQRAATRLFTLLGFMGLYVVPRHPLPVPRLPRDRARPRPRDRAARRRDGALDGMMPTSGSASSPSCSSRTSCSTASTSAPASSTSSSPGPTTSAARVLAAIGPVWDGNEVWLIAARRHARLRLPARLRVRLQRLLSGADDRALAAHPPRHQHRVPQARHHSALAHLLRRPLRLLQRPARHLLTASRSPTSSAASPSAPTPTSSFPSGPTGASAPHPAFWIGTPSSAVSSRSSPLPSTAASISPPRPKPPSRHARAGPSSYSGSPSSSSPASASSQP